jgi:hypothetical protein
MQIIQIRREAQSFDRALDVFLDVRCRIRDFPVTAVHAVESAFRCDWDALVEVAFMKEYSVI